MYKNFVLNRTRISGLLGKFSRFFMEHQVNTRLENCVNGKMADYDTCINTKLYDIGMKEIGCTVPWVPKKYHICTNLEKRQKANDLFNSNKLNQNNVCPDPCNFTNIYINPPSVENFWGGNDTAGMNLYFNNIIKVSEEYYLQNEVTLIGNIGGIVGLTLGISLVHIRDLINRFLDCVNRQ